MKSCDDGYPTCRKAEATGEWCKAECESAAKRPLAAAACSPSFSRFDESWKKEVMKMPKSAIVDLLKKVCGDRDHAKDCYINLHNAVLATIMENLHLADGDVCTLKILKDAIDFELPPENAKCGATEPKR